MEMPKITIDMSKVKAVLGKLAIIRNYSSYILPLVLGLVALALFIVGRVMSSGLRDKIQKNSIQLGNSVSSYKTQDISSRQWRMEKEYQDALESDANAISELEKRTSQRELLSYELFPEPKDTSSLIFEQYGRKYRQSIEDLTRQYGAKGCPSPVEIAKAIQQSRPGGADSSGSYLDYIGDITSGGLLGEDKAERMIVDELCLEAARKANFYAEPLDIAGYEYWGMEPVSSVSGGKVYRYLSIGQSVEACWYWQLGYWMIEDVFKTIGAMNSDCSNVMDCPVKRLMRISFVSGGDTFSEQREDLSSPPRYIKQDDPMDLSIHTGRFSNDEMDVVHFKVTVIINPKEVLGFIEELCSAKEHTFRGWSGEQPVQTFLHNQITVLEVNLYPVNPNVDLITGSGGSHQWYRYGDDAVTELELLCEYIFDKAGYDAIKPEIVGNPPDEENY